MGAGFGSLALAGTLASVDAAKSQLSSPQAARSPHFSPKAKRVIFLFMEGGPSHVDLFDHKPELVRLSGTKIPFGQLPRTIREGKAEKPENFGNLLGPIAKFKQHGQSGQWMSDYIPHMHQHADKLCVIKSMYCDSPSHAPAVQQIHTGHPAFIRPSMGAWCAYGLGTENRDMPAYVAVSTPAGNTSCGNAFLPPIHQATILRHPGKPGRGEKIGYLRDPEGADDIQRLQIEHLRVLNRGTRHSRDAEQGLEGMIESFELAFKMQLEAPGILDIVSESTKTLEDYGVGDGKPTDSFGRQCLMARRLCESGVRFVQVTESGWDSHNKIVTEHGKRCHSTDQPVAALLGDLEQRGLLDETLVIWAGEFGRTPLVQNGDGRGHNPWGFTLWMAGGGVKPGLSYGETDTFGFEAVKNRVHIHDLHATILHLLGINHEKLTYRYAGRDFRLTDVYGEVVKSIIA